MGELRSLLEQRAERGEPRGATEVLQAARAADRTVALPVRDRHRVVLSIAVAAALIGVVATVTILVTRRERSSRVSAAAPASTADAMRTAAPSDSVLWMDAEGLVRGDPVTGAQARVVSLPQSCQNCPIVRVAGVLFVTQPRLLRVESGGTTDLGPAVGAFAAADGQHLYVVTAENSTSATVTHTTLQEVDPSGAVAGGPWTVPDGYALTQPANRAVAGGVLIQTSENAQDHTLAVWDPASGDIAPIGRARDVIDVFHRSDGHDLVAYTKAGCATTGCSLAIMDLATGQTVDVESPTSNGFYGGGAFSPDGLHLAAFAASRPDTSNPGAELAIVEVASGTATQVDHSRAAVGEAYGFAFWSPAGKWLYFGGSRRLMAHYVGTDDAVELPLPAYYSAVADEATTPVIDPSTGWQRHSKTDAGFGVNASVEAVASTPDGFVAVGDDAISLPAPPRMWTSLDGLTWNELPPSNLPPGATALNAVAAIGDGTIWVAGRQQNGPALWRSRDLQNWTVAPLPTSSPSASISGIVAAPPGLVVYGGSSDNGGFVWVSSDGATGTAAQLPGWVEGLSRLGQTYVALVATSGATRGVSLYNSADGLTWNPGQDLGQSADPGSETLLCTATVCRATTTPPGTRDSVFWYCYDGIHCEQVTDVARSAGFVDALTTVDGYLVAGGADDAGVRAWISTDGVAWTSMPQLAPSGSGGRLSRLASGNHTVVAFGSAPELPDFYTWIPAK